MSRCHCGAPLTASGCQACANLGGITDALKKPIAWFRPNRATLKSYTCVICGTVFLAPPNNPPRKYCCDKCRDKAPKKKLPEST